MLQRLRTARSFSRFFFSTYKCQERHRISEFLKDIYIQNLGNISNVMLEGDLKFANLVAYNTSQLNVDDENLRAQINLKITEQLEHLTPDLAYELVLNLRDLVTFENTSIYETIYSYCEHYYFLFEPRQLEVIERVFYSMGGGKFSFSDNLYFEKNKLTSKAKTKYETKEQTNAVLDLYGISVPSDELEVVVRPYKKMVEINFKKSQKNLTLVGISHEEWSSVSKVKDLINQDHYDFYFMELAPVTQSDIVKNKKPESKKSIKTKKKTKESIIDKFLSEYSQSPNEESNGKRSPYLEYFDKYDRIALLDGPTLKWYTDNILNNSDIYEIADAERVVRQLIYN